MSYQIWIGVAVVVAAIVVAARNGLLSRIVSGHFVPETERSFRDRRANNLGELYGKRCEREHIVSGMKVALTFYAAVAETNDEAANQFAVRYGDLERNLALVEAALVSLEHVEGTFREAERELRADETVAARARIDSLIASEWQPPRQGENELRALIRLYREVGSEEHKTMIALRFSQLLDRIEGNDGELARVRLIRDRMDARCRRLTA